MPRFPVGKLPAAVLGKLLEKIPAHDPRLVIGPRFGEDAAVIDQGDHYLVAKTDPITFTAERIGWYAVHINANDVATLGTRPRWFLAALLLPEEGEHQTLAESVFEDALTACRELGITLVGGHTEITARLDRPLVVGHLLGEVAKEKLVRKDLLRPGDVVILTKGVAIEGTAILAREKAAELGAWFSAEWVERAQNFIFSPGLSVVREALAAAEAAEVHAMHDPTEGGLAAGLCELAAASGRPRTPGVGLRIWKGRVRVLPETRELAERLRFDPLALIASGALLIAAPGAQADKVLSALEKEKVDACVIGEVTEAKFGLKWSEDGRETELSYPAQDEIARLLA